MLRADIEDVYGDARSCRVLGMVAADGLVTAVPTRAPGDLRYQQHHDAADVDADGNKVLSGPHDPGNRPSSGFGFELRSTHNHYRQRADAVRRLARAPGKRSQQALSQPREFCPHRSGSHQDGQAHYQPRALRSRAVVATRASLGRDF